MNRRVFQGDTPCCRNVTSAATHMGRGACDIANTASGTAKGIGALGAVVSVWGSWAPGIQAAVRDAKLLGQRLGHRARPAVPTAVLAFSQAACNRLLTSLATMGSVQTLYGGRRNASNVVWSLLSAAYGNSVVTKTQGFAMLESGACIWAFRPRLVTHRLWATSGGLKILGWHIA